MTDTEQKDDDCRFYTFRATWVREESVEGLIDIEARTIEEAIQMFYDEDWLEMHEIRSFSIGDDNVKFDANHHVMVLSPDGENQDVAIEGEKAQKALDQIAESKMLETKTTSPSILQKEVVNGIEHYIVGGRLVPTVRGVLSIFKSAGVDTDSILAKHTAEIEDRGDG